MKRTIITLTALLLAPLAALQPPTNPHGAWTWYNDVDRGLFLVSLSAKYAGTRAGQAGS